ncbi:MAG TPA: PAS domain S-box protein, partial [Methanotrichaceae archaeon]|nr:PAS domain S-box protein [Methanotrichaceae archaeon]
VRERNPERLLAEACNILVQTRSYSLVWVGQAKAGHKHIVPVACAGRGADYLDNIKITWDDSGTGLGPAGMAVKTGKPACCQDIAHDPSVRPWRKAALAQGFASVLAVPMILGNETFRVLTVYADRLQAFDDEEIGLMEELAGDLAFALQSLENEAERKRAEKLLQESENKYHTIFENSGTAIVVLEEDTTISLANAEIERLTGYAKEEIEGKKSWTEFVAKDDLERMLNQHHTRRIDPDVPPKSYEFHLVDKSGCIKNCLLTVDMIPGSKKSIASFIDVTERKRAEAALWREQKFNNALLENMVDGVVACDANGILTLFNRTAREWHGLDCMRLPPVEWASHYDLFCEDGITPMSSASVPLFRAFQGEMLRDAGMVIQAKGQPSRYVLANCTPFFDEIGRKLGAVGVMHDITERKAMEEKLAAAEEKYRLMVENLNDVIFTLDLQGVITYISPVIEQISGYAAEEVLGRHFGSFVFPEDLPGLVASFQRSLKGLIEPFEFRTVNKAGHIRHVRTSTRLLLKGNKEMGLSGVLTDITKHKRIEEALRESDAKFRLLFERSADAMLLLDEGKFIDCNQAAIMMMGYSTKDELLNHYPFELSPEKQPDGMSSFEKADGLMKEAFETGSNRFEWVHCRADGKEFPVDVTLTVVPWNGKQILYTLWKDITEQKKAEEALRESKDFLDKIINSIGDPIFVKDREHRMALINDVACKSFGLTRDEILGHTTYELFPIKEMAEVSWEKDEE